MNETKEKNNQDILIIRNTLGLFNSMINSGEQHTATSEAYRNNAHEALDRLSNQLTALEEKAWMYDNLCE